MAELEVLDMTQLCADRDLRLKAKKKERKINTIAIAVGAIVIIVAAILLSAHASRLQKYTSAVELAGDGKYSEAAVIFEQLGNYNDSKEQLHNVAFNLAASGSIDEAVEIIQKLGNYADTSEPRYILAVALAGNGKYQAAVDVFTSLGEYKDSKEQLYNIATIFTDKANCDDAVKIFTQLGDYRDSKEQLKTISDYQKALGLMEKGELEAAEKIFSELGNFADSEKKLVQAGLYAPYAGEFVCIVDGESYHLTSAFVIEGDNVYWDVDISDGELIGLTGGSKTHFFFTDCSLDQLPVSSDMTVSDTCTTYTSGHHSFTITASFEDGDIDMTPSGDFSDLNDSFWNRHYVKVQ